MREVEVLSQEIDKILNKPEKAAKRKSKILGTPLLQYRSTIHLWKSSTNSPEVDPNEPLQINRPEVDKLVNKALWGYREGTRISHIPTDPAIKQYLEDEEGFDFSDDEPDNPQLSAITNTPNLSTDFSILPAGQILTRSEIDALLSAVESGQQTPSLERQPDLGLMEHELVNRFSSIVEPLDRDGMLEEVKLAHQAFAAEHNNQLPLLAWDTYANEVGQKLALNHQPKLAAACFEVALGFKDDAILQRDPETVAGYSINFVNAVGDYFDQKTDSTWLEQREEKLREAVHDINEAMNTKRGFFVHVDRAMDLLYEIDQIKKRSANPDMKEDEFFERSRQLKDDVTRILKADNVPMTADFEGITDVIIEYGKAHNYELPQHVSDYASELGKILGEKGSHREASAFFEYAMDGKKPEAERMDYAADFIKATSDFYFQGGIVIDRQLSTDWLIAKEQNLKEAIRIIRENRGELNLLLPDQDYEKYTNYTTVLSRGMFMLQKLRGPVA